MTRVIEMPQRCDEPKAPPLAGYGDIMSAKEVSEATGICERVVRARLADGTLPGVKIGCRWVVPKNKLIDRLGLGAA